MATRSEVSSDDQVAASEAAKLSDLELFEALLATLNTNRPFARAVRRLVATLEEVPPFYKRIATFYGMCNNPGHLLDIEDAKAHIAKQKLVVRAKFEKRRVLAIGGDVADAIAAGRVFCSAAMSGE